MYINLKPLIEKLDLKAIKGVTPVLGIIKYSKHVDSEMYIKNILSKAKRLGVKIIIQDLENIKYPGEKIVQVQKLSDGVLPIRPLPENLEEIISFWIDKEKDIDNFKGKNMFKNCTGQAVLNILKYFEIGTEKDICIAGRGIGKEIYNVLLKEDYSPRTVHSKTPNENKYIKEADVVISATGVRNLITKDMIKKDSLIIDVGLGDVDPNVAEIANVTEIRNGVGAVTTAVLFQHLFECTK